MSDYLELEGQLELPGGFYDVSAKKAEEDRRDRELFFMKQEMLRDYGTEVTPLDFYRDVFPEGSFEREGHPEDHKSNGIITIFEGFDEKGKRRARNRLVFDDLSEVAAVQGSEFAIMSPVGYFGRNRSAHKASDLYGIAIDLDGVERQQLKDVFYQAKNKILPYPTYVINSGHGLHLYYLFEDPIPLYRSLQPKLKAMKHDLTTYIWNPYTSTLKENSDVQYQGIFQGFRVPGTQTKLGKDCLVTAYRTGKKVDLDYLNQFVKDKSLVINSCEYESELPLAEAKEKYPDWYEKRIVRGEAPGRWHVKRDLYDWWLRKIMDGEIKVGHRYSSIGVLASYGVKCDIDEETVLNDALALVPYLDSITDDEHNHFTEADVLDAMLYYQESYINFSRKEVERVSGLIIPANKRNGRKQEVHLERARLVQTLDYPDGSWRNKDGRPKKKDQVQQWRTAHPEGTPKECMEDTGISKNTVYKWWELPE